MEHFEYKEIIIDSSNYLSKLNDEGKDGWECITQEKIEKESWDGYKFLLKRKLNEKFEYVRETYNDFEFIDKINIAGRKGWQVVHIFKVYGGKIVIYKRKI